MMMQNTSTRGHRAGRAAIWLALLGILLLGSAFRFYNVNWDEDTYHIHPDERHTTMVITRLEWPASLAEYFDTSHSPLNARNVDMVYFYGTLPLFLTKAVAGQLDALSDVAELGQPGEGQATAPWSSYDRIHLVGRVLSALFDLGSVILTFVLARRLFGWRVGLVAAFLLAVTVLNIQGSHYFAVDTFLTFFVLLTVWFTLDVAEGRGWSAFLGLGVAMGLTLACKVSVFLLVAVVALGGWVRVRRRIQAGEDGWAALLQAAGGLVLAAFIAIAIFRVAQPYAWAGPNYTGWDSIPEPWGERLQVFRQVPEPIRAAIMPNPQWIADIASAGAQQTGEADLPWGRQWTERAPWLWPLENMVLWTLGVPLGVTAWVGVILALALVAWSWHRERRPVADRGGPQPIAGQTLAWDLVLIPLAWVLLNFGWQGMQYVKSVRYFLPLHPYLVTFAAALLVAAWDGARGRGRGLRLAAGALAGGVLIGTLLWAVAFIQIYTEPVTRVQATRWMYENVETAATLYYRTPDGESRHLQLPLPSSHIYATDGEWQATAFVADEAGTTAQVVMNNLGGLDGLPRQGTFEVQLSSTTGQVLAQAQIQATFGGDGGEDHALALPGAALEPGQTYFFESRTLAGAPLLSRGSAIANEHFDDPLPFSMDGRIAFGAGPYRGLDLALYDEDTPEKLNQLLGILDEADYISMSSGRLWQSIPRLPMRYPMTTRYYDLLFAEELGFEKVVEFHAYPRLLGIEFDDTWAEEQFTVYDHPKVLIYVKTAAYDRERARELLSRGIEWETIPHWLNPRDVPEWRREQARQARTGSSQNDLMLTPAQRYVQERGGTWASLFNRNSLANGWPTASWLLLLAGVGLATLPLTLAAFGRLPDRGYILARPLGLLLLAWLSWMLTNLTALHYSRGTILLALGLLAAIAYGSLLLPGPRQRFVDLWRRQWRLILVNELLFLVFFGLFWFIRWGNPDLWHPWKGGEKPMDLAYLNAVIKSTEFPPYDPWFAGGYLNYYYFGQVLVGTLIKLVGIAPAVAYNLAIPAWFAMTAMGAFSVTYNLVARSAAGGRVGRRVLWFALAGALFVAVLGNLGEIHLLLLKVAEGVLSSFDSTIPGLAGLVRTAVGSAEVLFGGKALPIGIDEWYWNASRAIPAGPYEAVITEFPFFTFLYGDLHAHLIAMPLTLLSLALALAVIFQGEAPARPGWQEMLSSLGMILLWALTIGAMRTSNTWDVPPHLLVALGTLAIAEGARRRRAAPSAAGGWPAAAALVLGQFLLLFVLAWSLLYRPFWASYGSFYNDLGVWTGTRTPLWAYLVVHGLFLFCLVSYLVARTLGEWRRVPVLRRLVLSLRYSGQGGRLRRAARLAGVRGLPVSPLAWLAVALLILLVVLVAWPGLTSFTRADPAVAASGAHAYRGLAVLALGLPLAILGLLLLFRPGVSAAEQLWTWLVLLGLAMSLGVEVIVIQGDIGRMNTVFKFYLQVWLLWAVAAAAALGWLAPRLRLWGRGRLGPNPQSGNGSSPARGLWLSVLAALIFFAALYPPLATSAKMRDRFDASQPPGLDGWAYMETANYWDPVGVEWGHEGGEHYDLKWDLEAIRWLLDNVVGSPTILEGHTPEYRWGARYSINTGLPTVLGWNWHQRQQRAAADQQAVWDRAEDIATLYNVPGTMVAEELLLKYDIRYVIVGPLEQNYYDPLGLAKFERMAGEGTLHVVFRNEGVTIYEVMLGQ